MHIDTTIPSTSRIYDYMLGGHHNFEIDRIAAQYILRLFPAYNRWARVNRWFLQMVAQRWLASGFTRVLDLGSGLPTQGHFHAVMPNARVVYSDIDLPTVTYARQVIGYSPLVRYIQTDVRYPNELLAVADKLFGGNRQVAISCLGIAYFIDDDALAQLFQQLHTWAAPGSVMAVSFVGSVVPGSQQGVGLFKRHGSELFLRDEPTIRVLAEPWSIVELQSLERWADHSSRVCELTQGKADADMYGVLLQR
jgi:O-methyltransferase involved in polyketide biosynthesis